MKSDKILLPDVFENLIFLSTEDYRNVPLYSVSPPGSTYQYALNYTDVRLQTLQGKDLIFLMENNIREGISSIKGDRFVKSDENKR